MLVNFSFEKKLTKLLIRQFCVQYTFDICISDKHNYFWIILCSLIIVLFVLFVTKSDA